ncbi:hypothetical protein [Stutzerimonas kunmingensis]|jgi:hypothetical protein|uniref:hypothetical protein n=1 Tax=Stutzerimonas kunmingensis TaxID=1211807 RepID=UPI0028AB9792|nr:hypothetical protein [Stutzerimonas kunmingensis]
MNALTQHCMITIGNDGPLIKHTNYWQSEYFHSGYALLSWNAGVARLLLPDVLKPGLRDMKTAEHVIISCGPMLQAGGRQGLEILFDDYSDNPFTLSMSIEQALQVPADTVRDNFRLTIWTRGGLKQSHQAMFRRVTQLPCMAPWGSI